MARQPVHIPPKHSPSPFRRTLCNVRVVSVRFNHDTTNAKTSALNIRKNRGETLPLPEWTAGQSISEPSLARIAHQPSQRERQNAREFWARGPETRGGVLLAR